MRHEIPLQQLGPRGKPMVDAIQNCVHCGFCLSSCPTYQVLGQEMDSPRGRIYLMKEALEGNLALDEVMPHVDRCLGCQGCVTACPSGVEYGELISPFREWARPKRRRAWADRLRQRIVFGTLPYPRRFRWAARSGLLARPLRGLLPARWRVMLDMLPERLPASDPLPTLYPAQGPCRARVALLAGCAQQVLAPGINRATLDLLSRCGVETVIPARQGCCGALAWHAGEGETARRQARRNLGAFPDDIDAIVSNAAGCSSAMREYELIFRGTDDEQRAKEVAGKTVDVTVFLDRLGVKLSGQLPQPMRVAYHDACHLRHAQGIGREARDLLAAIEGLELVEVPSGEVCCGSAGTYNIDQPDIAEQLGIAKARNILDTGADAVAAGNIGCIVQIERHLAQRHALIPVYHTVQLLEQATRPRK